MLLHVTAVRPLSGSKLWLRFSDGIEGEADLGPELEGPVFGPLRDATTFAAVRLDPEIRTVAWPNGADFAPEFLRSLIRQGRPVYRGLGGETPHAATPAGTPNSERLDESDPGIPLPSPTL